MTETVHWIKGSDNVITLELLEDDDPLAGIWNEVRVTVSERNRYPDVVAELLRLGDADGITFNLGTLRIQPALLTPSEMATIATLRDDERYRGIIRIKSSSNQSGVHFGEDDSDDRLYFIFHTPP